MLCSSNTAVNMYTCNRTWSSVDIEEVSSSHGEEPQLRQSCWVDVGYDHSCSLVSRRHVVGELSHPGVEGVGEGLGGTNGEEEGEGGGEGDMLLENWVIQGWMVWVKGWGTLIGGCGEME